MEDVWSDLGCIDDDDQTATDSRDCFFDNFTDPLMGSPIPLTSTAIAIKSRGTNAPPSSGESASTKTTSESASHSSNFTTPSLPITTDSPLNEKLLLQDCASIPQSSDSIAQVLEYMRACNSRDVQSPSFSASYQEQMDERQNQQQQQQQQQQQDNERETYRKKERTKSSTTRKQKSPIQRIKRSLSQGGDSRSLPKRGEVAMPHRSRSRSKTSLGQASEGLFATEKGLQIDTQSAVKLIGPSGLPGYPASSGQQCYSASAGTEHWMASKSPVSTNHLATSWPVREGSARGGKREQNQSLSLMEYLNRPEGVAWTQHFQNQNRFSTPQPSDIVTSTSTHHSHGLTYSSHPTGAQFVPSYLTALPATGDVISALGLQQTPNYDLIQAFQTAFVLGMQQLNMAGHFRQQQEHYRPPSSVWPIPDHFTAPNAGQSSSPPLSSPTYRNVAQPDAHSSHTHDGSAVLEGLLHDINQQRPDQQEFSLDEFLAYVATTVESRAEAEAHHSGAKDAAHLSSPDLKSDSDIARREEKSSTASLNSKGQVNTSDEVVKKKPRRRATSISGQLSKTHLLDVAEEGKMDDVERVETIRKDVVILEDVEKERKPSEVDGEEDATKIKARMKKGRKAKADSSKLTPSASLLHGAKENAADLQAGKVAERRRRRRESHNAVERRRRDHINERIAELASLLPESMLLDAIEASTTGGTMPHIDLSLFVRRPNDVLDISRDTLAGSSNDLERKANALEPVHSSSETLALAQSKPNKGIILSKSVDYIKHLHEFCSVLRSKNKEMQKELDDMKDSIFLASVRPSTEARQKDRGGGEDHAMSDATPPPTLAAWLQQQQKGRVG